MTLTRLLKERKITQIDFAAQLNVSQSTVSKWCRGIGSPKVSDLCKITQILGVDLETVVKSFERNLNARANSDD